MTPEFEQAKALFLAGVEHFEAGRLEAAEQSFAASLEKLPGRASTLSNLGGVRVRLGKWAEALPSLEAALAAEPDDVQAWCHRATALAELGRLEEALAADDAAIGVDHACLPAWRHRGLVLHRLQRHDEALASFEALTRLQPGQPDGWLLQAEAAMRIGRYPDALEAVDRCLALDDELAAAWTQRGMIQRQLQRPQEAAAAFERAIALGADTDTNRFFLASLGGGAAPATVPRRYVTQLFDDYADDFDRHLLQVLHYRGHEVLTGELGRYLPGRVARAADLGCGTGLCGPLLRPLAAWLEGVDIAPRMVEKARASGCYDAVTEGDLVAHLQAATQPYDLLVAGDVFIYTGELASVFAAAAGALAPRGVFCFSVEEGEPEHDFALRPTLSYAHAEHYVRRLASEHGMTVLAVERHPLREDQRRPIPGLYVYLRAPG